MAWIPTLAQEIPHAMGAGQKEKKKKMRAGESKSVSSFSLSGPLILEDGSTSFSAFLFSLQEPKSTTFQQI